VSYPRGSGVPHRPENPRVSWDQPPNEETLDDFLALDVHSVHLEALDDCSWYCNVWLNNGDLWQINLGSVTGRAKGFANAELAGNWPVNGSGNECGEPA
jgi:hypothetical protein